METLSESLKKSIIAEGLEVLYFHGNLSDWASTYRNREEILVPGELEFVRTFAKYLSSNRSLKVKENPRYYSRQVDELSVLLSS
jgi:hypothetical protein